MLDQAETQGKKRIAITPKKVAETILWAIEKRKAEVYLPKMVLLFYCLHFLFPRFSEWMARKYR
jgi:short-subunit dehydrogenase